ncbi:MAG: hypothetical protein QOG42_2059 [Solirubrobacteraceae bacterium]|nr:hypothetical protein [Solirubrobacteraceae bacterium]
MQAYLAAVVIVGASLVVGRALWTLCGWSSWSGAAPAAGLAALLIVASAAVRLPGDGATAAVALALVLVASLAHLWRTRAERERIPLLVICCGLLAFAIGAIPFVATNRIGVLGIGINNDNAVHLVWAEALRSDLMAQFYGIPRNYPIGPHSLLAALADGTGIATDRLLTGLQVAIPPLTAIAAYTALHPVARVLRVPAAVVVAFTYMLSAWYAQGAFKEPMVALFVLAFAVILQQWIGRPRHEPARGAAARIAIPLGVLLAGVVLTYSYAGAAWLLATTAGAAGLLVLIHIRRRRQVVQAARDAVAPALAAAGVAIAGIAVVIPDLISTFRVLGTSPADAATGAIATTNLGNLVAALPLKQAFGVWPTGDFRFPAPAHILPAQSGLELLAVVAAVYGVLWCLRRREVALPAAVVASLAIYLLLERRQSPYVAAKALVVLAPLLTAVSLRALLAAWGPGQRGGAIGMARWLAAAALVYGLVASSLLMLRAAPVESQQQRDDLVALQPVARGGRTLFLGVDDFAGFRLRDVDVGYVGGVGTPPPIPVSIAPDKPWQYTHPLDFDSIVPAQLDTYRYVITTRTAYASAAPPNFRRIRVDRTYELWERRGSTPRRALLTEDATSGALLRCPRGQPAAGAARRRFRHALIWARPPVIAPSGAVPPGGSLVVSLKLPRGTWDLSLQYVSNMPLRIEYAGRRLTAPANTTRPGPLFGLARVRSRGETLTFYVISEKQSRLTSPLSVTTLTALAATAAAPKRVVALRAACGRYVDRLLR